MTNPLVQNRSPFHPESRLIRAFTRGCHVQSARRPRWSSDRLVGPHVRVSGRQTPPAVRAVKLAGS